MEGDEKTSTHLLSKDNVSKKTDYGLSNVNNPEISDDLNKNGQKHIPEKDTPFPDAHLNQSTNVVKDDEENGKQRFCLKGITKKEIGLVIVMGLVELSIQSFLSLLGPFFAIKARSKGVSATEVGLIFGIVPLVSLILSPLYGSYIRYLGVKFLLVTGVLSTGYCCLLFGFIDWVENPVAYSVLCFLVRGFEGAASAAACTAVYGIMAHNFPDRLATMSAFLEAMSGLGFLVGAPIGGALYEAGGFQVPFLTSGAFMVAVGMVLWVAAPSPECQNVKCESRFPLLWRPRVAFALINLVAGIAIIGFYISRAGAYVAVMFEYSPLQISGVYFCSSGCYLLGTLFWGTLAETWPTAGPVIFSIGYMSTAIAFMFLGPAPFLHLSSDLWMFYVASCIVGLGLSSGLIAFQIVGTEAKNVYGNTLDTSGWVGGILNAGFSLGEFLGPVTTGYLHDLIGFQWTCVYAAGLLLLLAIAQLISHLVESCLQHSSPPEGEMVPFANMAGHDRPNYSDDKSSTPQ